MLLEQKAYLVKEDGAEGLDPAGISKNLVKAKEEIENIKVLETIKDGDTIFKA